MLQSRWRRPTGSPVRTCIGCRRTAEVSELVRVFRPKAAGTGSTAGLALGAGPGRGAWLCRKHPVECLDQAIKRRSIARALRADIPGGDLDGLRAKLENDHKAE